MKNLRYSVYPRYTAGSPAQVSEEIAQRVAREEREAHARALTGVYGDERQAQAECEGLHGIAEAVWEERGKLYRMDLITMERGAKQHRDRGG